MGVTLVIRAHPDLYRVSRNKASSRLTTRTDMKFWEAIAF